MTVPEREVRGMRILVADDQREVRSALRLLLEQEVGKCVVGEASDPDRLILEVGSCCPDVLLLDWELTDLQVPETLASLRSLCPQLLVIALSGRPEVRPKALAAGADAFVSKGDPPEYLLATLRALTGRAAG